jgi:hypothetical protein
MASPMPAHAQRADRGAVIGAVLAVVALIILFVTFRGLVLVTLPLAAAAFVLGVWGAVSAARPVNRLLAVGALVLGLLLLLVSLAALAADLNISDNYDVYTRQR